MSRPKKRRLRSHRAHDGNVSAGVRGSVEDLPQEEDGDARGLTGRPHLQRLPEPEPTGYGEEGEPLYERGQPTARAIPANCLRILNTPLSPDDPGGRCSPSCAGRQRDDTCLAEIVRAANQQGSEWLFDLERDRDIDRWWWVYVGDPVDLSLLQPKTRPAPQAQPPAEASSYVCPHCGATNDLDPSNWHFWCASCGRNANEEPAA